MNPRVRAKRILDPLQGYASCSENQSLCAELVRRLQLAEQESPLGVYENSEGDKSMIVITDQGLYFCRDDRVHRMLYDAIDTVGLPNGKGPPYELHVRLRDGVVYRVPVTGRIGQFLDVLEVLRYLDRVIVDVRDAMKT